MPWKIEKRDDKFCVIKESDGSVVHCHDTREQALAQQRALYASENKAVWTATADLPDSAFLFIEAGGKKVDDKTRPNSLRHLPVKNASGEYDPAHVRNAIARANQIKLKDGSRISESLANRLKARAQAILSRLTGGKKSLMEAIKAWFEKEFEDDEPIYEEDTSLPNDSSFSVYKSEDDSWRFKGLFTNDILDRDGETLTLESHEFFLDSIEKGIWPMPELWPFHVDCPVGVVDDIGLVKGDDNHNYILVSGYGYPNYSQMFKAWSEWPSDDPLGMSHGMPRVFIKRDEADPSRIVRYLTKEVTVLPQSRAANTKTMFIVEEKAMKKLNPEQLEFLKNSGMGDEEIEELQKMAAPDDMLNKEEGEGQETADPKDPKPDPAPEPEVPTPEALSTKDIQDLFKTVADSISVISQQVQRMADSQLAMETRLGGLEKAEEEKVATKAVNTPAASLEDMIRNAVVGKVEAKVDGRTKQAQDAPHETPAPQRTLPGVAGMIPFLANLQEGDWRKTFQKDDSGG